MPDLTVADRYNADKNAANIYLCSDGFAQTAPVGSFPANPFGLHDVLGNVWEWTEDCYVEGYAGAPTDGSARTDGACRQRVLRGSSWLSLPWSVRSAHRNSLNPSLRDSYLGFRLARTLP